MPTIEREGFCLNCGRTGLRVMVTWTNYEAPPPLEVPAHCDAPRCLQAKAAFDERTRQILEAREDE